MRDAEFATAGEVVSLGAGADDVSEGAAAEEVSGAGAGEASVADGLSIGRGASRGCVRLNKEDVFEVYDFLTLGSKVTIR